MATTEEILEKYKNLPQETIEYDEDVDGGVMMVREKHLDEKELLKQKFEKSMKAVSSGKTAR